MFHAFFRSTLPVLPLLLVLSPVNSSSCTMENKTTEIRVKYENILIHDINELVNISAQNRDRCCKNKKHENIKVFFCNDTQEIESLQSMACNMLRFFHKQRISKAFRWKAAFVSCGTLQVLKCKCEGHRKEKICPHVNVFSQEDTETGEQSRKKCNQEVCELKENISSLRSCWNKFEKIISR
ncbi:interleukin-7 [Neopelma chrysocephalum]|uniref:interleukin-7 n=1 Tax=Neopelma chrysocephalum TaxID=114329 RepID=UPI000FCD1D57|nr:interleukin-7 [Neopelma chrysocephalum]XP_027545896.1 interleukin-7 [Neopelma chrysocephalum]